jgi:hypothetical protein
MKLIVKHKILDEIDTLITRAKEKNQTPEFLVLTPEENSALMEALGNYVYDFDLKERYRAMEKRTGKPAEFRALRLYRGVPVFAVDPQLYVY